MNRTASIIISTLLVFALTGAAFSAERGKALKTNGGEVTSVDMKSKTIMVKNDQDGNMTFVVGDRAVVRAGDKKSKPTTFEDIKVGSIVALVYDDIDGKKVIRSITVLPPLGPAPENKQAGANQPKK